MWDAAMPEFSESFEIIRKRWREDVRIIDAGLGDPLNARILGAEHEDLLWRWMVANVERLRLHYVSNETIAEWLGTTPSTVTHLLADMEAQGLIKRRWSGRSRRIVMFCGPDIIMEQKAAEGDL